MQSPPFPRYLVLRRLKHKKWNYVKKKKLSTIVNCEVLKLVLLTFSKMSFLFIISSLFLPQPEFKVFIWLTLVLWRSLDHSFSRHKALVCFKAVFTVIKKRTSFENCITFTNCRRKPCNTSLSATDKRQKQSTVYVYVSVRDFPVSNSWHTLPSVYWHGTHSLTLQHSVKPFNINHSKPTGFVNPQV